MRKLFFILFFLVPNLLFAASDFYPFDSSAESNRFQALTSQLRCLVCQNQNLAESNAPLAEDLRKQVYEQVRHGKSDQEIIAYLVSRYGDFILYRPPFNIATLILWLGPLLFLLIGLSYLIYYLRKTKRDVAHD
jgi:cytochrome c-type biogenesis protein CcmH